MQVDFQVGDATELDGMKNRFDTIVDSAFYHVLGEDEDTQGRYAQALHRAARPAARLYMFEAGRHNVNGIQALGLPADNFERVLPAARWRIDYLGPTTYQGHMTAEGLTQMLARASAIPGYRERMQPLQEQLRVIGPMLENHVMHWPVWTLVATRQD